MEGLAYALLFFVGSGWALYCVIAFVLAFGSIALRARRGASVWLAHLGIALILSLLYPAILYVYRNVSAAQSRQHYVDAADRYAVWEKTLPTLDPGNVAAGLDAMFRDMPGRNTLARNEVLRRVNSALATPGAAWSASDLDAFDGVADRLEGRSRDPGIVVHGPPADNPFVQVTAWHRHRDDLATAAGMCDGRGYPKEQICRAVLKEAVCHWCSGAATSCDKYVTMASFGPAAEKIGVACIVPR
jgi:hypothetical protein